MHEIDADRFGSSIGLFSLLCRKTGLPGRFKLDFLSLTGVYCARQSRLVWAGHSRFMWATHDRLMWLFANFDDVSWTEPSFATKPIPNAWIWLKI